MTIRAGLAAGAGFMLLAGCATAPPTAAPAPAPRPRATVVNPAGLERVLGRDADAVIAVLGAPDQDQREDRGRRLQFAGPACVLDVYFYPKGNGAAVATWIDARTPAGTDFDRASCVAALSRR
jgi:hypothetical protein